MAEKESLDTLQIGLATPPPEVLLTPNIGVIGVGGAGGNAINNMIASNLSGVSFFCRKYRCSSTFEIFMF